VRIDLNEMKTVLKCIENGEVNNKPSKTISLLAKYYCIEMDASQTIDEIDNFMNNNYKTYNSVLWSSLIETIVKQTIGGERKLIELKSVNITESEIEFIKKLKSEKIKKLAFTYLIYAKIFNYINPKNNNWVSSRYRNDIFKDANVTETGKEQLLTLHKMLIDNIVVMSKNITNNSLNVENYINEKCNVILVINDFRELGLQYLKFIGDESILICSQCGKCIKQINKKSRPIKYCNECSKLIKNEQNKTYNNYLGKK